MKSRTNWLLIGALAVLMVGCGSKKTSERASTKQQSKAGDVIAVQHVLVGFQGSVPGKNITRTKEEAQKLAEDIFARAKAGSDFDALVREFTDDQYPGIYRMANTGVAADVSKGIYSRGAMVPAFGNIGFSLKVGEVGMAPYDEQQSPYGWHIIKRVE